jgi:hypothetical protein
MAPIAGCGNTQRAELSVSPDKICQMTENMKNGALPATAFFILFVMMSCCPVIKSEKSQHK